MITLSDLQFHLSADTKATVQHIINTSILEPWFQEWITQRGFTYVYLTHVSRIDPNAIVNAIIAHDNA